jgi:hypothetical protein
MDRNQANKKLDYALRVERVFELHHQAMLASLRVVLGLPPRPITLEEERK